jgi:PIN domain nuclease of toxin-antitoxin system
MLLLDTCTLLWMSSDPSRLSESARGLIREYADGLFVSAISAFEIAIKHRKDAITLPMSPHDWYARVLHHHGINELPVTGRIAMLAVELPPQHNDPCDRIIIATARVEGLTIVTPDSLIQTYPEVQVRW